MTKTKLWSSCALLFAYIASFGYLARYSSPSGDDFIHWGNLVELGFWGSQVDYWLNWTSRFSTMSVQQLGNMLGVLENYGWHVPIAILVTLLSLYFLIHTLFPNAKSSSKLFFALLIQAAWLSTAFVLPQSLYWYSGFYYYWTSAVFLIELALIVKIYRGEASGGVVFLLALLVFLNSGVSEISAAYQLPMYLGAAAACCVAGRKRAAKIMWLVLLVALAGFALQVLNPGNAKRIPELYHLGPNPIPLAKDLLRTYAVAAMSGVISFWDFLTGHWIIYSIFLFVPSINKNVSVPEFVEKLSFRCKLWYVFLFELVTVCCFQAIGGYSMGNFLYARAMATVYWIMFAQWVLFFVFMYRNEELARKIEGMKMYRYRVAIFAALLLLSANSRALVHDYWIIREYADKMEERKAYTAEQKALGNRNIVRPSIIKPFPRLFMADNAPLDSRKFPGHSHFYGFDSIQDVYAPLVEAARVSELERMKKLIELSNEGDMDAQVMLAMYLDGSDFNHVSPLLDKNDEAAWNLYYSAAKKGDAGSQRHLWMFYLGGLRSPHDAEIIKWGIFSIINPF